MLFEVLIAFLLAAFTIWLHAAGIALLMRYWTRPDAQTANCPLHNHQEAASHCLLAVAASSRGDFALGTLLPLARLPTQRRSSLLFFRNHLHYSWLRRYSAGKALAATRPARRTTRRPHVQFVDGLFFCRRQSTSAKPASARHYSLNGSPTAKLRCTRLRQRDRP